MQKHQKKNYAPKKETGEAESASPARIAA